MHSPDPHLSLCRQLSRLTQAFSMAGVYYYPLLNTVASSAREKLSEFDPGSLTNLIKCFSRLGYTVSVKAHLSDRVLQPP